MYLTANFYGTDYSPFQNSLMLLSVLYTEYRQGIMKRTEKVKSINQPYLRFDEVCLLLVELGQHGGLGDSVLDHLRVRRGSLTNLDR